MTRKIHWGILSTGNIARTFAEAVLQSRTGRLIAVASRSQTQAKVFGNSFRIPRTYGKYKELLQDPDVDAVYIATPHPFHIEWAIEAAKQKKHIFCEKPLTINLREALRVVEAARKNQVFLMEAFMYRCHPQTRTLVELIKKKTIGDLRLIQARFCFDRPVDLKSRLFNKKLGGGAILDIGCYPVSMARLLAGVAMGKSFLDPEVVMGTALIGKKSRVDELAIASLRFPGGILAELCCGIRLGRGVGVTLWGSKGRIHVPSPWHPGRWSKGISTIEVALYDKKKPKILKIKETRNLYALEVDEVGRCLSKGRKESPNMSWADSLGNMKTIEQWLRKTR
jgi:predicted dehydrogenase